MIITICVLHTFFHWSWIYYSAVVLNQVLVYTGTINLYMYYMCMKIEDYTQEVHSEDVFFKIVMIGSTSTYIYYHKLLRLFRKLVFLAFQWDLISPNKCVTYFYKKLIPSLVYTYNRRCTGRTFHRSSGTWYRDSSRHILAPDGHTAGSCVPSYYCCCLSLAESYGSAWTTTCQWKPVR